MNSIPSNELNHVVSSVEGLSKEDEERDKRGIRSKNRKTFGEIKRSIFWFSHYVLCGVLLLFTLGFIILIALWVNSFIDDPVKIEKFIFDVAWAILIIFATLFFQGVFSDSDS